MDADGRRRVEGLWLSALERIAGRAAHEVRGALNGVAVNLEVVRSRAARAGAPADGLDTFAETAASQLEAVTRMTEALLALARPARQPVDVGTAVGQLAALLTPAAASDGVRLDVHPPAVPVTTAAEGSVVRLVLASAMLAAIEEKAAVTCTIVAGSNGARVTIAGSGAAELPADVVAAVAESGVVIERDAHGISIGFPAAASRTHETA